MLSNLHFVNSFSRALQQERWNPWSYSQPFYWLCLQMQLTVAQTLTSKFFLGTPISWKHTASRIGMHVVSHCSLDNMAYLTSYCQYKNGLKAPDINQYRISTQVICARRMKSAVIGHSGQPTLWKQLVSSSPRKVCCMIPKDGCQGPKIASRARRKKS